MSFDINSLQFDSADKKPLEFDPKWSSMQRNVFTFVATEDGSANVEAVAGSGKTTTILESMKFISGSRRVNFLAFNRSIADELRSRVPSGIEASTFHSLGNAALRNKVRLKMNKRYIHDAIDKKFDSKYKHMFYPAVKLIDLARNMGFGIPNLPEPTIPNLYQMADDYDMLMRSESENDQLLGIARSIFLSTIFDPKRTAYDFTDMLYLPLYLGADFPEYDIIYVDEAQDLNFIQHMMIERSLIMGGRVIAVGDTHQAIYGFRGADSSSMGTLAELFDSKQLPLSISYRCPKAVVAHVQHLVPHIEAHPSAIEGSVQYEPIDSFDYGKATIEDMIICRNNAPLINVALKLLAQRKPMRFLGDFGDKLITFVRSFKTSDITVFRGRITDWYHNELARLEKEEKYSKMGLVEDKFQAISLIMKTCHSVDDIIDILVKLFEQGNGPIIASIHKSKGLEAKTVYFVMPELIPSKYAKTTAAIQQENNLMYVGCTRAKENLVFLNQISTEDE